MPCFPQKSRNTQKVDRIRVEIQANYPKLTEPTAWDGVSAPFVALTEDLLRIKTVLGQKLQMVWHEVAKSLKNPIDPFDLLPLVAARIKELRPNKSKQETFHQVVTHISTIRSITMKDLKRMGWDRNDLKVFADAEQGFLAQERTEVAGEKVKRVVNGVYHLVPEWLARKGKPIKEAKTFKPLSFEKFKELKRFSEPDPFAGLNGSALVNKKSLFG